MGACKRACASHKLERDKMNQRPPECLPKKNQVMIQRTLMMGRRVENVDDNRDKPLSPSLAHANIYKKHLVYSVLFMDNLDQKGHVYNSMPLLSSIDFQQEEEEKFEQLLLTLQC